MPNPTPDEMRDGLRALFEEAMLAVHEHYEPGDDPEFGEAASDYAASALSLLNAVPLEEVEGVPGPNSAHRGIGPADLDAGLAIRLHPHDTAVLKFLWENGYDELCYSFDTIGSDTGLARNEVRDACRSLAHYGLAHFTSALMNDAGELRGAGYGATHGGGALLRRLTPAPASPTHC